MPNQNSVSGGDPIIGKATIIQQLTESIVRASLPNGKIIHRPPSYET